MTDRIDYGYIVENSLRNVVKDVLAITQTSGLLGNHHFYIGFDTTHEEVEMPKALIEKYPEEMLIVLQYQFKDLVVEDDFFSVTLSFDDIDNAIKVPFSAVTSFSDPSASFGLQFSSNKAENIFELEKSYDEEDIKEKSNEEETDEEKGNVVALDAFRKNKK